MPQAYRLLGRDFYAEILEAHMADRRKQLCDRADIAPISKSGIGPKLGMFRVQIENPPEDVKTIQPAAEEVVQEEEWHEDCFLFLLMFLHINIIF